MKTGYSMSIRWWRRAYDGAVQFLEDRPQTILARNWRALNALHITRMRVLSSADRLAAAIALAEK